jgi:cell division protein FtsZ
MAKKKINKGAKRTLTPSRSEEKKKIKKTKFLKPAKSKKFLVKKKIVKKAVKGKKLKLKKIVRRKIVVKPKKVQGKKIIKKISKKPKKSKAVKKIVKRKVIKINKGAKRTLTPSRSEEKKVVKHKAKIVPAKPQTAEFAGESLFKAKIKVIGIGGGGGSIVSEIGRSLEKATFVIADTDIRALKKKSGIKYFWFGEELTHGLGTGVNVDLAKQAALSAKDKMSNIFKDQDIIIFVASLGGGLGSGATQVFAEVAREFGGITLGIFTMPFKFEGKNKYNIAQTALKTLRQSLNVSLVIPNEKIFKIIDSSTPITNAFSTVNKSLIESLESLIDLIYNPGVINIDFADLRTILKGRGNTAFLNTVEETGKDRVEKTCENIFKNPLLQNSSVKPEKILFNIAGSDSLSMFEVEKISSYIDKLNPNAKIIFGISKNPKLKNKIKTTILMTGGQMKEEAAVVKNSPAIQVKRIVVEELVKEKIDKGAKRTLTPSKSEEKKEIKKKNKTPKPPSKKIEIKNKKPAFEEKEQKPVSFIPVFEVPVASVPVVEQSKLNIVETPQILAKKTIRRSGLEIKEAEELQEKKKLAQEKEWEIPAFLRKVKFKS